VRVIIAEDETLLRHGLRLLLEQGGFEVVAALGDAPGLEAAVEEYRPELVVTDIRMPPTHTDEGLAAGLRIRRRYPGTAVMVLSQHVQRRHAEQLLNPETGKVGYLLKQRITDVETFLADLRRVAAGGTALDPDVVAVMVARARRVRSDVGSLTPRQQEVLALVAEGHSNSQIAARLVLSEKAVVQHTSRIYDVLGIASDAEGHRRVLAVIRYLSPA
jgi:DNA-binding NarL/FixJ family response regulator